MIFRFSTHSKKKKSLEKFCWQLEERSYEVESVQNKLKQCRHYGQA
jgi:uncharacterized protein (UPF0179 family)